MFIVYVAIQKQDKIPIYPERQPKTEIITQVITLLFDEAPTMILAKYSDYNNIFSRENVIAFLI